MDKARLTLSCVAVALLAGCASVPTGPRVTVMPAVGKPFEVFVDEDRVCRQWAAQSVGSSDAANQEIISSAAVGTALGAVAGAIAGGHNGAGSGAAVGMAAGGVIGAERSSAGGYDLQRRYDIAYEQCMYAKGNQVPGYASRSYTPPPPPR